MNTMIKKGFLFLFALTVASNFLYAQKENEKLLNKAENLLFFYDYYGAYKLFKEVYEKDTSNHKVAYRVGLCMYNLKKLKRTSQMYFEKGLTGGIKEANYYLGNLYHLNMQFDRAIEFYKDYLALKEPKGYSNEEVERLIIESMTAKELTGIPVDVKIENFGKSINSKYSDYVPLLPADESFVIFTSRRDGSTGGKQDPQGEYFEDIYISKKEGGNWGTPASISQNINSTTHDACVALSADGNKLYLYRTDEDMKTGKIYTSEFNGKEWSSPLKMGEEINSEKGLETSLSTSADGNAIYFSSIRPGGYGGKDIYRIVRLPNGKWSEPYNLGPLVNTKYDEDSPYIHPDGQTLFFSSKGHKNMGGYDIFRTNSAEGIQWSDPENLGYPINSTDDDIFFTLSLDGRKAFYSSTQHNSEGETDLYTIYFPDEAFALSMAKGTIITTEKISATITLIDFDNRKITGVYTSNSINGSYLMIVSPEKNYKMIVEADGYYPHIQEFSFTKEECRSGIKQEIKLTKK